MSYQTAIERMYALGHELTQAPSHKFDLAHMRMLLAALENPERRSSGVLIAGTNGKGSTAATLASILQASGVRTGLYTSPHLVRINERVRINGGEISDEDLALPQQPQAKDVIGNTILEMDATAVSAVPYVPPVAPGSDCGYGSRGKSLTTECTEDTERSDHRQPVWRYPLQVMGQKICVETPLIGRHQLRNVALAIAAAEELGKQGFPITAASIEHGIRETKWPGRFQVIPAANGTPEYVFDVAHNPAGAWALRSTLSACYEDRRLIFVFGALRDKAIGEMAEILFPVAERVIATRAENPRSATPDEICHAAARTSAQIETAPDVAAALAQARASAGSSGVAVVTGSIYVVGEAMRRLGARI